MKTKELYLEVVDSCILPVGRIGYVYKDKQGVIQIGKDVCLELRRDEKIAQKAVETMKAIENADGFMFWNNSPEGKKFFYSMLGPK